MSEINKEKLLEYISKVYKPHPWHGISYQTSNADEILAYIEIVPTDGMKYEMDKKTGYLMIDRPQKFSNFMQSLYGFVPQTYCGKQVAAYANEKTGRNLEGDGDALDICVLSEKPVTRGDLLVNVIPIGGFRMIDSGEADDKIIAVLKDDFVYGGYKDISDCSEKIIERMRHFFLTYKGVPEPGQTPKCEITHTYNRAEAMKVIELSHADYKAEFDYASLADQI